MLYHIWYNMCMNDSLKILPARFFKTASGTEPVREWLKDLDKDDSRIIGGGKKREKKGGAYGVSGFCSLKRGREHFGVGSGHTHGGDGTGSIPHKRRRE